MKYIESSVSRIKEHAKNNTHTIIRIETDSGSERPRLLRVLEVGEDYIVGRGRTASEPETFGFAHITNWRFAKFVDSEWKW